MIPHLVPTVPIIHNVSAVALSLFAFQVDITLLTDGGQSVTLYTVSVCMCTTNYNIALQLYCWTPLTTDIATYNCID